MCGLSEGSVKRQDNMWEWEGWEEGMKEREIKKRTFLIEGAVVGLGKTVYSF